jgi:hypothetical protein
VTTDEALFDSLKSSIVNGDLFRNRQQNVLDHNATVQELVQILKDDVIDLKNISALSLFRAFYLGRNLSALRCLLRRQRSNVRFHTFVKNQLKISKAWTYRVILLYSTYKRYPKLMLCNMSIESMLRFRRRILEIIKDSAAVAWYNSIR